MKTEQENEILKEKLDSYNGEVRELKALMQIYVGKLKQLDEMSVCRLSNKT